MTDTRGGPSEIGRAPDRLSETTVQRLERAANLCPSCGHSGKSVPGQTVKALLNVSLREIRNEATYLFCRTPDCPVVYFVPDGAQTFTVDQVRERVYQKEPESADVLVCYCFRYQAGEIRSASHQRQRMIIDDINVGIQQEQCACDLRNPQGTCCLGNILAAVKSVK